MSAAPFCLDAAGEDWFGSARYEKPREACVGGRLIFHRKCLLLLGRALMQRARGAALRAFECKAIFVRGRAAAQVYKRRVSHEVFWGHG